MNKKKFIRISVASGIVVIFIACIIVLLFSRYGCRNILSDVRVCEFNFNFLNSPEKQNTIARVFGEQQEMKATEALHSLVNTADRLSSMHGTQFATQFNFEVASLDGKFTNFGILRYVDDVRADSVIEEHAVVFREGGTSENNLAEVDRDTSKVVSMHRKIQYSDYQSTKEELEKIVRQFLKETGNDPDKLVSEFGSAIEFSASSKGIDGGFKWPNYFFRWEEKGFALPKGVEMELAPFMQVGITSGGFIFSYDNTIQLYHNLPKEALRAICAFVEMPQSDDSFVDREKGIVKVYFSEYKPFRNRYLVLPYEPENNFEGCSDSAKAFLRNIPPGRN